MARLPRLSVGGHPHLIVQRGFPAQPLFVDDDDRRLFLAKLAEAARAEHVAIHAYVLLDTEIQILATPKDASGVGRMMQSIGRSYVAAFNRRHARSGTLWQARYRGCVLEAETFFIACMRYVEARPTHLGHGDALDYLWSSAAHHVGRQVLPFISEHPMYWRIGNTPFDREAAYRSSLEHALTHYEIRQIEEAAQKGWVLGSDRFVHELAKHTDRRLRPLPRGRPSGRHDASVR